MLVGGATKITRHRGEIVHEYDHLVKVVKQKEGQNKRAEVADPGSDHDYHILEGPDEDYADPEEQVRETMYHVPDDKTPVEQKFNTFHNKQIRILPGEKHRFSTHIKH